MIINSLLDTDWYKITQGQVVHFFFSKEVAKYKFILREDREFPEGFDKRLQEEINNLATLKLSSDEYDWLSRDPNIYNYYLNWFSEYQFDPKDINITFDNKKLNIMIEGSWEKVIYYEVPLLAIISELYFSMTGKSITAREVLDRTLDYKAEPLFGIPFVEFGTRRRFSFEAQNQVINGFLNSKSKNNFIGTSNPYFANRYGIKVIGTYAHESPMAMQVLRGVDECDSAWLEYWKILYGKSLNVALSDTLTTKHFLGSISDTMFQMLDGIRQDSGDPFGIGMDIVNKWRELGIDPKTKNIVFSDNLDPVTVRSLWERFKDITNPIFGIGTNLTNDFGVTPLNMVIKLTEINGKPVVKLSDDHGKETGDPEAIALAKDAVRID